MKHEQHVFVVVEYRLSKAFPSHLKSSDRKVLMDVENQLQKKRLQAICFAKTFPAEVGGRKRWPHLESPKPCGIGF